MEWKRFKLFTIISWVIFCSDARITEQNFTCPANCSCGVEISCNFVISTDTVNVLIPSIANVISFNITTSSFYKVSKFLRNKPNLHKLSITGNLLSFPILPNLPSLDEFSINNSPLHQIPSEAFANIPNISCLNISNNNLKILPTNSFSKLHNLKTLDLSNNEQLVSLSSKLFTNIQNLQVIILSRTGLSSISSSWLSSFKNVRILILTQNNINFLKIGNLPKLEVLDLSFNSLRTLPSLSQVPNLMELYASNTLLTDLKMNTFGDCTKLSKLVLRSSRIAYLKRDAFFSCNKLRELDLSSNYYLGQLESGAFNGLVSLHILKLNDCPNLLELEEDIFKDLKELREIHLQNNNIRVLPVSIFTLKNLHRLNLEGNFILCDCHASKLTELRPILKININQVVDCVDGTQKTIGTIINHVRNLDCQQVKINSEEKWNLIPWGDNAILECNVSANPKPDVIWQTVDRNLQVMNKNALAREWLPHRIMNALQTARENEDKFAVLPSGHLLIKNITRRDIGRYKCFAFNSFSNSSHVAFLGLDDTKFRKFIIESILIGIACAVSFLLITLLVQAINFIMIRLGWICCCCEKRLTRKAQQIRQLIETIESYRSTQLDRLKENYNSQVASIKDGCYQQMEKVRESYSHQSKNLKDLCDYSSQQITGVRDQYLDQVNRIREYSLSQMSRVRVNYVFQRNRIRKFSSHQMLRIRETYKYQQKTLNKLLENLPDFYVQACRTGSCRRTDSFTYDDEEEEIGDCDAYYQVAFMVDNQSLGSSYYTPIGTLTRKGKRMKHSRNASIASSGGGFETGQLWFTPRGSVTGDSPLPIYSTFESNKEKNHYSVTAEVKSGHRRCYSLSENFAKVPLFQLNSVVVEEGDAGPYTPTTIVATENNVANSSFPNTLNTSEV